MKKTIISVMLLVGLIINPTSAFTAQIYSADAILTPAAGNLMGGLGCFVGGEVPGQYDWTIGNCVPGGTPTDDMVFSTNDATGWKERMRITKEGNVGIGITGPGASLDVRSGSIHTAGHLNFTDSAGTLYTDNWIGMANNIDGDSKWLHIGGITGTKTGEATAYRRIALYADRTYFPGNVGIGTTEPNYKLDVEGYVQAHGYYTGDITFQKDGKALWRMFEDEEGLYLESLKTGKVYRFVLQEVVDK